MKCFLFQLTVIALGWATSVQGAEPSHPRFGADVEGGLFGATRNEVQIPNDTGTRFSLLDLTGSGPDGYIRGHITFNPYPRHQLRLTAAPIETSGSGTLDQDIHFNGARFTAGSPIRAEYQFNSYRLGYRWTFFQNERWEIGAGAVALVRDASIELTQGAVRSRDSDVGVVPLLHAYLRWQLAPQTYLALDGEGLGAPQGRALDVATKVVHEFGRGWSVAAGYRTFEGGVDNDTTRNFAWFHFGFASVGYAF